MPHRPNTKAKSRILVLGRKALELRAEGLHNSAIADQLGITTATAKRYIARALATESMYPGSLTPEAVAELRQIQAEVLANSRQKAIETHAAVVARIGTPNEKNMDATASARLLEAVVRAVDLESALFGTRQPLKVVEEQLRYSYRRTESKVLVSFDRSPIEALAKVPLPGLTITVGSELNGNATAGAPDRLDAPVLQNASGASPGTLEGD